MIRASIRSPGAVRGLLPLVAGLACWQLVAPSESRTFPPPSRWAESLAELSLGGRLAGAVAGTLTTFVLALAAATVIGSVLGAAVGFSRRVDRAVSPALNLLAAIPGAAIVPLAILALGTTRATAVAVVALAVVWPVLHTSAAAARAVPRVRLDAARTLGLSRERRWRTVLLPSVAPGVLLGVRVAASMTLIVTLLVDILGTGDGIGRLLVERQQRFDTAGAWGLLFAIGVLGYLVNFALARAEQLLARPTGPQVWRESRAGHPAEHRPSRGQNIAQTPL
ncbi:ABC transporter permease [Pseudonocardia halophobica]|uniref:Nitrate ABC transporter permease n=1 Tax=Pseudonocardia halophobica TaxID=29401 RepID=A0A9W6L258_9PSEU|nr:ABC transporter permease subunit [Pseudonocardia halophobica]GLL11873.1 nitrate ABC transporter permease [Pseudonocardia halophobica]